jgi:phage/plasmid-like protein (TIGR03299 family)
MSHELTIRENGFVEHAYVGEIGWHGLGNELQPGAPIEAWLTAAGMDWRVQKSKVRYAINADAAARKDFREVPDQIVLLRSDNGNPLGIVSPKFKVVQPATTLEFFRDLVADSGFELSTAGTLFGGSRFWALAKIGEDSFVTPGDKVKGFLLLVTACDGSLHTTASVVATRVVCNNTLQAALGEKGKRTVKVSHRSHFDANAVKDELGVARGAFANFIATARELSEQPLSLAQALVATGTILAPKPVENLTHDEADALQSSKGFQSIMALFGGKAKGSSLPGVRGTRWGWLNAVTEYVDHYQGTSKTSQENRFNNSQFGNGADLKNRAFDLVTIDR